MIYGVKDALEFQKSKFYPYNLNYKSNFKYSFYLGIGGNLGDTKMIFDRFFIKLKGDNRFNIVNTSPLLLNRAFGYKDQPDFLNAVMLVQTSLSPKTTLKVMQHFEGIFKRKRSFKNAPRTLDLDILWYSTKTRPRDEKLLLPHPGVAKRASVLLPFGAIKGNI
ncbi:MAG: 2-amino-4-hydroxy-6-hydroxymethyldihydropteridine diphosphokinase [Campylobacter sp.]|nr:2-amino-4-hydroxy-6-hydroxymethyldihydropteridine diphosphokinase [Campylobacter sp.]